jgi:hypothetical protein
MPIHKSWCPRTQTNPFDFKTTPFDSRKDSVSDFFYIEPRSGIDLPLSREQRHFCPQISVHAAAAVSMTPQPLNEKNAFVLMQSIKNAAD